MLDFSKLGWFSEITKLCYHFVQLCVLSLPRSLLSNQMRNFLQFSDHRRLYQHRFYDGIDREFDSACQSNAAFRCHCHILSAHRLPGASALFYICDGLPDTGSCSLFLNDGEGASFVVGNKTSILANQFAATSRIKFSRQYTSFAA